MKRVLREDFLTILLSKIEINEVWSSSIFKKMLFLTLKQTTKKFYYKASLKQTFFIKLGINQYGSRPASQEEH